MASKILLVEDDNNLREIYEARLQAEGYAIVTAKDGEEALVVAKTEKPDLIISDVMMPRISGFEMLDILRNTEELKYTKVIMLTALGQADDKTRADSLGADRYLVKSQVTLEDIVKAAHELTDTVTTPAAAAPAAGVTAPASTPAAAPVQAVPVAMEPAQPLAAAPALPVTPTPAPEPVVLPVAAPPSPVAMPTVPVTSVPAAAPLSAPAAPSTSTSVPEPTTPADAATAFVSPVTPAPVAAPIQAPVLPPVPTTTPAAPAPALTLPAPAPAPVTPVVPAPAPQSGSTIPAVPTETAAPAPRPAFMTDFTSSLPTAVPVAPTPAGEPIAPASVPEPATTPEVPPAKPDTATDADNNATPTVDEKATVGAQIADFANAPTPVPAPSTDSDSGHDAALDHAVESLSSEPAKTQLVSPTPTTDAPSTNGSGVTIAGKKIIQPIQSQPKPDINELLAREEAKESAPGQFGTVVTPAAPPAPSAPASTPQPNQHNDFDPNNIAL